MERGLENHSKWFTLEAFFAYSLSLGLRKATFPRVLFEQCDFLISLLLSPPSGGTVKKQ